MILGEMPECFAEESISGWKNLASRARVWLQGENKKVGDVNSGA
jgi:hypothetical protein